MNSIKIELGAILALKNIIQLNDLMKDYINENDKEPSWDGHIYLYDSPDLKAENIKYRIPVQIKGKNKEELLKKQRITYPVQYKHLRNYYNDGGVFYIIVAISDDRKKTAIFYNALTTIKLDDLLKKSERKKSDQTKNIVLQKLNKDDSDLLFKILLQFGYDRSQQGSGVGGIIEKKINFKDINKIDAFQIKSYLSDNEEENLKMISTGELCLYGHRADLNMWFPFDFKEQKNIELTKTVCVNQPIGIDNKIYYENYYIEGKVAEKPTIRVSENLIIDLYEGKLTFEMHGNIESLKKDVDFLYAILEGAALKIDNEEILIFKTVNYSSELQKNMEMVKKFYDSLKEIQFACTKRIEKFDKKDWKAVNELINICQRKIKFKSNNMYIWYLWWWDEKVIPLLIIRSGDKKVQIVNMLENENYRVYLDKSASGHKRLPNTIFFKRDIWEKLYNVDKEILLNDITRCDYSIETVEEMQLFFVEILSAYDTTKNEKYYDIAVLINTKLLAVDPKNENTILNKLQLIKRKRKLQTDEIMILENMEQETPNTRVKCAVNILLDNKYSAQKLLDQLSLDDQKIFKQYPIYNLL